MTFRAWVEETTGASALANDKGQEQAFWYLTCQGYLDLCILCIDYPRAVPCSGPVPKPP